MRWRLNKEKLFWLREQEGWSQEEAGARCGVEKKQFYLWESGKSARPRKDSLNAITQAFQLASIDEIILKPTDTPDADHKYAYDNKHTPASTPRIPIKSEIKAVIFDLDGTLLKGFDFSWRVVWEYLGDNGTNRKRGSKLYHSGKINYAGWCTYCLEHYKALKLSRTDLVKLTHPLRVTKGLYETLDILKNKGFILGIISGGIDIFLDELIPNWKEYFDYIFVNKMEFDQHGIIENITPTPYDFAGKSKGIKFICEKAGIKPSNVAFVGESFNDKFVIDTAGLTIAYTPISKELIELFDIIIEEENLENILDFIPDN